MDITDTCCSCTIIKPRSWELALRGRCSDCATVWGSNPGRGWKFSLLHCSDLLWYRPNLMCSGYWGYFPGVKEPAPEVNNSSLSVAEIKMNVAILTFILPCIVIYSSSSSSSSSSSYSSINTTAHCGLWPVEQCPSIFSRLPPTLSIFSLPALEDLFLLPLSIFSWVFHFLSFLPVLE